MRVFTVSVACKLRTATPRSTWACTKVSLSTQLPHLPLECLCALKNTYKTTILNCCLDACVRSAADDRQWSAHGGQHGRGRLDGQRGGGALNFAKRLQQVGSGTTTPPHAAAPCFLHLLLTLTLSTPVLCVAQHE